MPTLILKGLDCTHQPDVALLDQVGEGHQGADEMPCDGNHQPEVAFHQMIHRLDGLLVGFLHRNGQAFAALLIHARSLPTALDEEIHAFGVETLLEI